MGIFCKSFRAVAIRVKKKVYLELKEINKMLFYCWYCHRATPSLLDGMPSKHSIFLPAISLEIIMINHKGTKRRKEKNIQILFGWPW